MYAENLTKDMACIKDLIKISDDYEALSQKLPDVKFDTLSRKSDKSVSEYKKDCVKTIRNDVKDCIKKLNEKFFFEELTEIISYEQNAGSALKTLFCLVKQFSDRLKAAKQEKNIIDFNDMEHYALQILIHEENGGSMPTKWQWITRIILRKLL